jgi:hypothetical protein
MKSKLSAALAFLWLIAVTGTCSADTVITFNVSATLTTGTLGGTVTIDETNPNLSTANITAVLGTGSQPFTEVISTTSGFGSGSSILIHNSPSSGLNNELELSFLASSFVGYNGGPLCSLSSFCTGVDLTDIVSPPPGGSLGVAQVGSLTPVPVPGPIAGAGFPGLILASGGLFGWWRRRRKIA